MITLQHWNFHSRHLLTITCCPLHMRVLVIGAVLAVLKAMLKLSEAGMLAYFWSPYIVLSIVTVMDSNSADNRVCVFIALCFSQLLHMHAARLFKILPFAPLQVWWWGTEARYDTTATFVLKPKFWTPFESTRFSFHTLCTRRILQL